ncbi:hypothetical protein GIY30_16740 [Gordonia sp. HNM0687]|uniref:Uncharacterized protein n=1 Tax=Gordonia mangrovi TaxID=2665643 RepID=A0A6L7GST9_9ACTN|nr:hypothetical protein [Gordonia mangrovi]MDY6808271.1 hypothetical protein [Actinomycetota bacterium]MXP22986.1 hypothetical protein [Gordonia mangrovi]UVF80817.1 hypothetical protein NWF22_18555 [Gordonia mangrovi]
MDPTIWTAGVQFLAAVEEPEGPEFGKASPLGLLVIIVLLVATAFLIRSMNTQLKKLPKKFDADHPEPDQAFDDGTDSVDTDDDGTSDTTDGVQADERRKADT